MDNPQYIFGPTVKIFILFVSRVTRSLGYSEVKSYVPSTCKGRGYHSITVEVRTSWQRSHIGQEMLTLQCQSSFLLGLLGMKFNAAFNSISVISWRSALLVEETRVLGENHQPVQVTDKLQHIKSYRVHLTWAEFELTTLVMIVTNPTTIRSRPRLPL